MNLKLTDLLPVAVLSVMTGVMVLNSSWPTALCFVASVALYAWLGWVSNPVKAPNEIAAVKTELDGVRSEVKKLNLKLGFRQ